MTKLLTEQELEQKVAHLMNKYLDAATDDSGSVWQQEERVADVQRDFIELIQSQKQSAVRENYSSIVHNPDERMLYTKKDMIAHANMVIGEDSNGTQGVIGEDWDRLRAEQRERNKL